MELNKEVDMDDDYDDFDNFLLEEIDLFLFNNRIILLFILIPIHHCFFCRSFVLVCFDCLYIYICMCGVAAFCLVLL